MRATLATFCLAIAAPASAEMLSGHAEIIDGDTLRIEGRKIRLFGIDAPELAQPCDRGGERWLCGETARDQLTALVGGHTVHCSGDEVDPFGRLVAICSSRGYELNRTQVEHGWATAFRSFTDAYVASEIRAKQALKGIWSSTFDVPQSYRIAQASPGRSQVATSAAPRGDSAPKPYSRNCSIKGNRNRRGEWIYHLPGMQFYDRTQPEEIFCSEAAAQAAGYRKAIVR